MLCFLSLSTRKRFLHTFPRLLFKIAFHLTQPSHIFSSQNLESNFTNVRSRIDQSSLILPEIFTIIFCPLQPTKMQPDIVHSKEESDFF